MQFTISERDVGQTGRYDISIAPNIVLHLLKIEFKIIPYLSHRKEWTGWDLNPRPQPVFSKAAL